MNIIYLFQEFELVQYAKPIQYFSNGNHLCYHSKFLQLMKKSDNVLIHYPNEGFELSVSGKFQAYHRLN